MTTVRADLWAKAEYFRRRYERLLPEGLYARVIEARPLTRYRVAEDGFFAQPRVRPSILLQVFADRLCGQDLWGLLRGQWVCSLRWDVGRSPSAREFRWAVAEGLEVCEREHRRWERRRRRWAAAFDGSLARSEVAS